MSGDHQGKFFKTGVKASCSFGCKRGSSNVSALVKISVLLVCVLFLVNINFSGDASPQAADENTGTESSAGKDREPKSGGNTALEMTDDPFGVGTSDTETKPETESTKAAAGEVVQRDNEELKNMKLPGRLKINEAVSLLDWTGEETEISAETVLVLTNRSDRGTLTLKNNDEILNARNLLFHLQRRIHWRGGLGRGKGGWPRLVSRI